MFPEQRLRGLGHARARLPAVAGVPKGARADARVLGAQAEPEALRVGLGVAALARLLVALGPLHLPGARELHVQGLDPKAASWPRISL